MQEGSRQTLLTFASARDEAAYMLFVANNARALSARVRIVTALVWAVNVAQFVPNKSGGRTVPGLAPLSSEAGRRRRLLALQGWKPAMGCCLVLPAASLLQKACLTD